MCVAPLVNQILVKIYVYSFEIIIYYTEYVCLFQSVFFPCLIKIKMFPGEI